MKPTVPLGHRPAEPDDPFSQVHVRTQAGATSRRNVICRNPVCDAREHAWTERFCFAALSLPNPFTARHVAGRRRPCRRVPARSSIGTCSLSTRSRLSLRTASDTPARPRRLVSRRSELADESLGSLNVGLRCFCSFSGYVSELTG